MFLLIIQHGNSFPPLHALTLQSSQSISPGCIPGSSTGICLVEMSLNTVNLNQSVTSLNQRVFGRA